MSQKAYYYDYCERWRSSVKEVIVMIFCTELTELTLCCSGLFKMLKIVIHRAVLRGRHVYNSGTVVGRAHDCHPERDNLDDPNAVAVQNEHGEVIGHAPLGL